MRGNHLGRPLNAVILICCALAAIEPTIAQGLVQSMVSKHRKSLVYLKITKVTSTGAPMEMTGTGFIISKRGHLLTSCHLVDEFLRDKNGKKQTNVTIDSVEIQGTLESRSGHMQPLTLIDCAQGSIDLALLKFSNTALSYTPVAVSAFDFPTVGDTIASMGFPLGAEFFARPGTMSSEAPNDTLLVDMTLNPGDSGAPVFNSVLGVIGVAESGYSDGAHIGVVRPIRHGAGLLQMAGVTLAVVNASIPTYTPADQPLNSKVVMANFGEALKAFNQAKPASLDNSSEAKITYVFAKHFGNDSRVLGSAAETTSFRIEDIPAKPGYKVVNARFIVTSQQNAEVLNVGPSSNGGVARATFEKANPIDPSKHSFVKGFIETTQVKLTAPAISKP